VSVPTIATERLDLVSISPAFLDAVFAGRRDEAAELLGAEIPQAFPIPNEERFLRLRHQQMLSGAQEQRWLVRAVVLRDEKRLTGTCGFHGNPGVNEKGRSDGVEIGYTIYEAFRGRGYATEAVRGLIDYARDEGMGVVVASVAPDNEPSLAIVRKLGFVETGSHWDDEDGLELEFELELADGASDRDSSKGNVRDGAA
jgi:[ribosomal protein S5]-alanine N-acetyltransferase